MWDGRILRPRHVYIELVVPGKLGLWEEQDLIDKRGLICFKNFAKSFMQEK